MKKPISMACSKNKKGRPRTTFFSVFFYLSNFKIESALANGGSGG
jgi:hypothetical protein